MNKDITNVLEGELSAKGVKIAIVCARFNEFFVSKLLGGAIDSVVRHGGDSNNIDVAWVPGSYELPLIALKLAKTKKFDAIIALGVVIQGATPHAGLITGEVNKCLAQISLDEEIPVINAVIATNNIEQAIERSGTKAGNKGGDAATTAIEMINLIKNL
jgi:6,7-dimethyl-8-ribityllumazine synthase